MRAHHRTDRVLAEFELMLGALAPTARKALTAAIVVLDQGARLYPRARGRRFTRLDDQAAEAYIRALLARGGLPAQLVQRLRGLVAMCYYELPTVQREIGYDPGPYIAAVSRRRLESYGPEIGRRGRRHRRARAQRAGIMSHGAGRWAVVPVRAGTMGHRPGNQRAGRGKRGAAVTDGAGLKVGGREGWGGLEGGRA